MKDEINYIEKDGVFYPDAELPLQKEIGSWGLLHLDWLKRYHIARYIELLMSGELNEYLYNVNKEAKECFDSLVADFSDKYELTEKLKARDQMKWVGLANCIVKAAKEITESEVIYI